MLQNKEAQTEKHQTFISDADLKFLTQILDKLVFDLDYLQNSHHFREAKNLIKLANTSETSDSVERPRLQEN